MKDKIELIDEIIAMEWWKFGSKSSTKVDAECVGWYPLPEE